MFFWLSFFIITLSPTMTPFGVSWVVAERYVYLGAIGIYAAFMIFVDKLIKQEKLRNAAAVAFAVIVVLLMGRTIIRNMDWKTSDGLWLATAKTSPSSPNNHNNLGDLYGRQGKNDLAIKEYKTALALKPNYADVYHNMANTYVSMKDYDNAIINYKKAVEINPNLWQSDQNLAALYFNQKDFKNAFYYMNNAVLVNPSNPTLHYNLGKIYANAGDIDNAKKEMLKALNINPQYAEAKAALTQLETGQIPQPKTENEK